VTNEERIQVYARQRSISPTSKRTWLPNIGQHAPISYWNVARVLTGPQNRRYIKKSRRPGTIPF
jgi:hypothetical protein